jgi:hypothetical protein
MWLESHETSSKVALFCEHFFKMFAIFQVYYFSWHLGHITWHNAEGLYFFDFFEFLMSISKYDQNGGRDRS